MLKILREIDQLFFLIELTKNFNFKGRIDNLIAQIPLLKFHNPCSI